MSSKFLKFGLTLLGGIFSLGGFIVGSIQTEKIIDEKVEQKINKRLDEDHSEK